MFLDHQIQEIGKDLIKKAGLANDVEFSTEAPSWSSASSFFDAEERVVYSVPERSYYEFRENDSSFFEKFGWGTFTYLSVQKIIIAHEVGHASQKNLTLYNKQLRDMKSMDSLAEIGTYKELRNHVKKYRDSLLKIETDAWDIAWRLLSEDESLNAELFEVIKWQGLDSYKSQEYTKTEEEFLGTYRFLAGGNDVVLIGFKSSDQGTVADVKINWNGNLFRVHLLEQSDGYLWLGETLRIHSKETSDWELYADSADLEMASFAVEQLKKNLMVTV